MSSASNQKLSWIKEETPSWIELKRVQVTEAGVGVIYRVPRLSSPVTLHAAGRGLPHVTHADASDLTDVGGKPAAAVLRSRAVIARSVATADLDGDHANEVITGFLGSTGDLVTVRRGHRDGTFEPPVSYPVDLVPDELVTGDFDDDRRVDIVVAQSSEWRLSAIGHLWQWWKLHLEAPRRNAHHGDRHLDGQRECHQHHGNGK